MKMAKVRETRMSDGDITHGDIVRAITCKYVQYVLT